VPLVTPRPVSFLLAALLAGAAFAQTDDGLEAPEAASETDGARPEPGNVRGDLRRELLDTVRQELDTRDEALRGELASVQDAEAAREVDLAQLQGLARTVNLVDWHGYFRLRGDLFNGADLGRGTDPSGRSMFPKGQGGDALGAGNLRLRLNPTLRLSDDIVVKAQFDVLDNSTFGGSPLLEPSFDAATGARMLSSRIAADTVRVKRLWAEVETPLGQLAFGRMPLHFGEGMLYNDGNCFDCDYGNTFDRVQLKVGPFARHVVTLAADALSDGATSATDASLSAWSHYGAPVDTQQLDDAYRLSVAVTRSVAASELRRRLDAGETVLQYGALGAYRTQHSTMVAAEQLPAGGPATSPLGKVAAHLWEVDLHGQLQTGAWKLATEWAGVQGRYTDFPLSTGFAGRDLSLLQGAGVLRGQHTMLAHDALLVGVDLGIASGDKAPGQGARPGRPGSATDGSAGKGDVDGRQFCTTACNDRDVTNFRMNPDFRVDQLLWRNLYTTVTDAWFARAEARYKPGGRLGGDDGLEASGALVYSQAVYGTSTPSGGRPLGVELDAGLTYTSKDRFFTGLIAGFLLPLSGLDNPNPATGASGSASLGQIYRVLVGTTF
jgi:uncharacterized protein (TIGR04551 family)